MKRIGMTALLVLAALSLTAGSGTKKSYRYVTGTGAVLGTGSGLLPKGRTALSIGEIVSGAGTSLFVIWGRDLESYSSPDTIPIGNGITINEYYPQGIDSVHAQTISAGAEFLVITDNKP